MRRPHHDRSARAGLALAAPLLGIALTACPTQPILGEDCPYDPAVGNCFETDYAFSFDDARVDAMDLASLPSVGGACRDPVRGRVMRVVDGDTFDVMVDGAAVAERVRLIGVDTPETYVTMGNPHCYGADAKLFSEELTGRRIALSFDRDCDDDNMRTLAYVWAGPRENDLWERQLLRRGYAHVLTVRPNDAMESTFVGDEAIARAELRGLWLECQ
jgi:endonuclease YncB( thermonuclease family)